MTETIWIILLNFNALKDLRLCLASLTQHCVSQPKIAVVIVDYSHTRTEYRLLSQEREGYPFSVHLLRRKQNLGFSRANNIGIKYALDRGAEYIMLLNSDTLVSAKMFRPLLTYLQTHPQTAAVSPKIYFEPGYEYHTQKYTQKQLGKVIWYAGGFLDWANMYGTHRGVDQVDTGQFDQVTDTDFVTGCCMLVTRKVLNRVGLLNESLFLYWEDSDWSQRALAAGYQLRYVPQAYMWHKNAGTSSVGSALQTYFHGRNRLWFGMRYAPVRTRLALMRQAFGRLLFGSYWEKQAVKDGLTGSMGMGSWQTKKDQTD